MDPTESNSINSNTINVEESWVHAVVEDNADAVRELLKKELTSTGNISLGSVINKKDTVFNHIQSQCILTNSPYTPDNVWCLAAMFDARRVLQVMKDFEVTTKQTNSHGNTFLHCIIAYASMRSEEDEQQATTGINFIKTILSEDEFKEILLTENDDYLRPIELAAHLGTFILFKYLFENSNLYMTKTETRSIYTVQYYDVTEYVNGKRRFKSPLYLLMFLDKSKHHHKSTHYMFLDDPMASWFTAVKYSNMPAQVIWAFLRIIFIISFFYSVSTVKYELELYNLYRKHNETLFYATTFTKDNITTRIQDTVLFVALCYNIVLSLLSITFYLAMLLYHMIYHSTNKWVITKVSGCKDLVVYTGFFVLCQFITFIAVFILSQDLIRIELSKKGSDIITSGYIDSMSLIAACACVWDVLYFLQLVPGLAIYAIAVQRMMFDFCTFSVIFNLFFVSYAFGFYILTDNSGHFMATFYDTFRIMLNMVDFTDASSALQLLHITFIFMTVYLLLNILITIFSSSFEEVKKYKEIIMRVQALSLAFTFENYLPRVLESLYNCLRKKYFIFEDDKIYVTKVAMRHVQSKIH